MNYILPFTTYCKNFVWNIFHSLINYFFYIHVKNQHNINKNCYLFISRIGLRNRILINYINYGDTQYFKNMELKNIKLEINSNRKIPIVYIKNINISPKIFTYTSIISAFRVWSNASRETINQIKFIESIYNEIVKYMFFKSCEININYMGFRIVINNCIVTKNSNRLRVFIKKCKLYYGNIYISKIKDLKIRIDIDTNNINIYAKYILVILCPELVRNDVYSRLDNILKDFTGDSNGKYPNIYVKNVYVLFNFQNYMKINIKRLYVENSIIKFNANVRLWKKDVMWLDNILYNLSSDVFIIDSIRFRLFQSSADKIYKSLRHIIKRYLYTKTKVMKVKPDGDFNPLINSTYCDGLVHSVIESGNINNSNLISTCQIDFSYMNLAKCNNWIDCFIVKKFRIDFENSNGSFIFDHFIYSNSSNGFRVSSKKWLYFKDEIRFLDTLDNKDTIRLEFVNESMFIHTYKLFLNLDIKQYKKTFGMFADAIDRIMDTFTFKKPSKSYIFDKFYLCSFRSVFSYNADNLDVVNLLSGHYNEVLNILDLTNMDIILKDNTILYPKDFGYILDYLVKNIIEDVIDNNFDTVIKKTPVAFSYNIKNSLSRFPKYAKKVYKTINANI